MSKTCNWCYGNGDTPKCANCGKIHGDELRNVVICYKGRLYLEIENALDSPDANDVYWNSNLYATRFTEREARDLIESGRFQLNKTDCSMRKVREKEGDASCQRYSQERRQTCNAAPKSNPSGAAIPARDQALNKITGSNIKWADKCLQTLPELRDILPNEFIGEQVRKALEAKGLMPDHPNAWGALMNTACKRNIIEPTGDYRKPTDEASHARAAQVWKFK